MPPCRQVLRHRRDSEDGNVYGRSGRHPTEEEPPGAEVIRQARLQAATPGRERVHAPQEVAGDRYPLCQEALLVRRGGADKVHGSMAQPILDTSRDDST